MADIDPGAIAAARKAGYSDNEIVSHLSQTDPRFKDALGAGYQPTEILDHFMPSSAADFAKSAGSHVLQSPVALAGLPGDIAGAIPGAADWLRDKAVKFGLMTQDQADADRADMTAKGARTNPFYTSQDLLQKAHAAGLPQYEPQTPAGEYGASIGDFVGPGLAGKLKAGAVLSRIASNTLAGGASEAAGQATQGTSMETPARILASIAAPGAASKLVGGSKAIVPTADQLKSGANASYDTFRNSGLAVKPSAMDSWATSTKQDLDARGLDNQMAPQTHGTLNQFNAYAPPSATVTGANLDTARKKLGEIISNNTDRMTGQMNSEAKAAVEAKNSLMQHITTGLSPSDVLSGSPTLSTWMLNSANQDWGASQRLNAIDRATDAAGIRAASQNSGLGLDNKLRQQFSQFLLKDSAGRTFSPAERAQIDSIVRGTRVGNVARIIGNQLGGGAGIARTGAMLYGAHEGNEAGGPVGGLMGFLAPAMLGGAARRIATRSTQQQIQQLTNMVALRSRLGAVMGQAATPGSNPQAAIQALIALSQGQQQ